MFCPLLLSLFLSTAAATSAYAPITATCPSGSLVRAASGLSDSEETYRVGRKAVADVALKAWLEKTDSGFGTADLPTVRLDGGGYRAMLLGGGVIQALDGRDSSVSTSGLYQALTYQAGLSGGGWMLTSLAGNNYPTISYLLNNLWKEALRDSILDPEFLLAAVAYTEIADDVFAKDAAGYDTTIVDPYGRLLGYQLYEGSDGGVAKTLSSITTLSNFVSLSVPYPILTALGAKVWLGECTPGPNATTYELTPYEFGSWDSDLSAFMQTSYLGTSMKNGIPTTSLCTKDYDNLGFIAATSSNIWSTLCLSVPVPENSSSSLADTLAAIVDEAHEITTSDEYARYPNPFYEYQSSTQVPNSANDITAQEVLSLVDGGQALQNNPVFPFLQPARNVSVLLVNDNSDDTSDIWPNGTEILTTYVQSFNHNLTRMPYIPPVATFLSQGLNKRATFFGCNDTSKVTIVYLPNYNFTYDSNKSTAQLIYSESESESMVQNGGEIATQGGKEGPIMTQEEPSRVKGELIDGEVETNGQEEYSEPALLSSPSSQGSAENRPQIKRSLAAESYEEERLAKILGISSSNPGATFNNSESASPSSLDGGLCSRCEGLDIKITDEKWRPFRVVARLGDVNQLLNSPECRLCRLLHKVRPVSSTPDAQGCSDCSLVLFDGKWAKPWKAEPSLRSVEGSRRSSRPGICFDTFAMMDNEIMLGVLVSKDVEYQRSYTVPYLHDRLYESLTRSGYIRVLKDRSLGSSEFFGAQPVGSHVNWNFLRTCMHECAFNHPNICEGSFDDAYEPLKVIDCRSRKVIKFLHNAQYLALSYTWGSEQSSECAIDHDGLPDTIPTTISDAMEATLQLGFQFLWVDRYCIPQNQDAIKHKEIRHMDMIYKRAAGTIVACSGKSPWYGLPGCSSRSRSGSGRVAIDDRIFFSVPSDPRYEIEASNWMSRGWTYQEGLLSRRRIFFTEDQIYFECDARHCFESTGCLQNNVFWEASQKARIFSIGGRAVGRHDFYKTVNQYSGRKLTYESDILNGVWGVLRTFCDTKYPIIHYWGVPVYAKQSGYDCIAGFTWDLVRPAQRRAGFPSWSWSGWIGQVKPGLLVKLDHDPTDTLPLNLLNIPSAMTPRSSNIVEKPQDILQINLPNTLEEEITLQVERSGGTRSSYLDGSLQYFNSGGLGLSSFLHIKAWMTPATLSTSGVPKVLLPSMMRIEAHLMRLVF
ncbi:hypothetical protein G7Y89_g7491 [Cudoniella acicularis]|uniref:Lysophospholipase n=1 Tax=Cudoniella acicularis TaxID=354080 RepID=A0A8H4RLY9_9HELO|nr:hypothetical protein G7Y89_g7491 [Cudoniella acicularis]